MRNPSQLLPFFFFFLWIAHSLSVVLSKSFTFPRSPLSSWSFGRQSPVHTFSMLRIRSIERGGSRDNQVLEVADDERYNRQVYTLGPRAQGLVRSSTIYVDGPATSGLVYECAKNLALSGVGNVVLWTSNDTHDEHYHNPTLDDLGKAYQRAAQNERKLTGSEKRVPAAKILEDYIRRLNPSVRVARMERPASTSAKNLAKGVILCIDRPYVTQVKLNQLAREQNVAFVAVETAGVYGRVFCDFGRDYEVYDADGETPLITPLNMVNLSTEQFGEEGTLVVHTIDQERHDVSIGDTIEFQMRTGDRMDVRGTVVKVMTPYRIKVKLVKEASIDMKSFVELVNQNAVSFSRVKIPTKVSFLSLEDTMKAMVSKHNDLLTPCDMEKSFDPVRSSSVLSCFQAMSAFSSKKECLPTISDREVFSDLLVACIPKDAISSGNHHVNNFLGCCAGKLTPLQAMFGAVGTQEALKAATGLYNPVTQLLLYDCDELLVNLQTKEELKESSEKPNEAKTGLAYILGPQLEKKAKSTRLFVVGAGAIGCEVLKNLASLSVATGNNGCISLTDMDTIERSNLSRQLLFRDSNIGNFKSVAAQAAILRMNPAVKMNVYTNKVGEQGRGPFDEAFWSSGFDIVLNALDNIEARLFVDQQCVAYKKALVDAGTLGSKGNVQVVVPDQSESYGSSVDPPEMSIPVCTLKSFPYNQLHAIQWGRDLFDGLHQRRPRQAKEIAESIESLSLKEVARGLLSDLGDEAAMDVAIEVNEDLVFAALDSENQDSARRGAVQWAANLATRLFNHAIMDLLQKHPAESLDEDGKPFWTGTRKVPTRVLFSSTAAEDTNKQAANEYLLEFVRSAARLRLGMLFGDKLHCHVSVDEARDALLDVQVSGGSCQTLADEKTTPEMKILEHLRAIPRGSKQTLRAVEFEKDGEDNGHVQFVNAASNLRAICYGIPLVDVMETRRVAGNIVPAMITTTAVVSALSCIEFLKLLQKAPLSKHRNAFINLALPFFAFTMPVPVEEIPGPCGNSFTVWDSIFIKEAKKKTGEAKTLTLKRFIRSLKKAIGQDSENLEVSTISSGQYLIYANFLHEKDKEMMCQSIFQLVCEALEEEDEFAGRSRATDDDKGRATAATRTREERLKLSVTLEDTTTGEEFEVPLVRVTRD